MVKSIFFTRLKLSIFTLIIGLLVPHNLAWGQVAEREKLDNNSCSAEVKTLTASLLKDLPDYGNRVIQRTQKLHRDRGVYRYIITSGQTDFEPLNLPKNSIQSY